MEVEARMKRNYLPPSMQPGYQYNQYQEYQSPPTPPGSVPNLPPQNGQGSITAGTPNYSNQSQKKSTLETIPQGSVMGTKGSIVSGTPSQAVSPYTPSPGQFSPNQGSVVGTTNCTSPQGSIVSGTPMSTNTGFDRNYGTNFGSSAGQSQGSIVSGTPMSTTFDSNKNYGTDFGSDYGTFPNTTTNQGSITSGTPMNANYDNKQNYGTSNFVQPSRFTYDNNYGTNSTGNFGNTEHTSFGTGTNSNIGTNASFGSITSGTPVANYQGQSPTVPTGSITAGTPVPNNFNQNQYNTRQRKYSGPQRVKLQMLATVQEMGNFFLLFFIWGNYGILFNGSGIF